MVFVTALLATGVTALAAPIRQSGGGLFTEAAVRQGVSPPSDPGVTRARFVNVNFDLLGGKGAPPDALALNLFDDVLLGAMLDRVESNPQGGFTWIGHLDGVEHSLVILVVRDGVMVAKVSTPKDIYLVRYAGSGAIHTIAQIDPATLPSEDKPPLVRAPAKAPAAPTAPRAPVAPAAPAAADDGSVIDLLVVYSDDARADAGSTAAMESEITLAVAEVNTAYANSDISQRLALVHMEEISYVESNNSSTDLRRLTYHGGSYTDFDTVTDPQTGLRDTYHADHVVLVTSYGPDYTGLAWAQQTISTDFEDSAFSVMTNYYMNVNLTLAHELGHNMGGQHD